MNRLETFEQFLATQSVQIPIIGFVFNLIMATILAIMLGYIYTTYGNSISNRKAFARNLLLISLPTMVIITIVKSSLALSLGLVGALSIVRFRAAIKEPEELAYLFMAITIGLGCGADQVFITTVSLIFISGVIVVLKRFTSTYYSSANLYITVSGKSGSMLSLTNISDVISHHCTSAKLKRFDKIGETLEAVYQANFESLEDLTMAQTELEEIDSAVRFSILDQEGVMT